MLLCMVALSAASDTEKIRIPDSRLEHGPLRVWVFFADKGFQDETTKQAALDAVESTYDRRALERRRLRGRNDVRDGRLVDTRDLSLHQPYVDQVLQFDVSLRVRARWINAISIEASEAAIRSIAQLSFVTGIQEVARYALRPPEPIEKPEREPGTLIPAHPRTLAYGNSAAQLSQIQVIPMHDAGFTGQGVIIGILDTGFRRSHEAFNQPGHEVQVIAEYDFVDDDSNTAPEPSDPSSQHNHGTMILGCIGAYLPGELVGGAFDAQFVLAKTEDTTGEYQGEEDNYVAGLQFIESHGADLFTSSLGYIDWYTQADLDGLTAVTTIAVNTSSDNGVHGCTAAGNEYHDSDPATSSIIAPADAFRVITCGAVTSSGGISSFSSDGPTADGRLKPELLARGSSTHTVSPSSDTSLTTADGTSLSTPLLACAVACLVQAHPDWTVDEMRDNLFFTAGDYLANGAPDPAFVRGYGIVNAWGAHADCNDNGIPDVVEISQGTEFDCQPNGILDSCEFATGQTEDCNGNGIPDSCDLAPPALGLTDEESAILGWIDISASGTPLGLGDDEEAQVTMPFTTPTFPKADVVVGNNGAIGFGGTLSLTHLNGGIPSEDAFGGVQAIFALWDDIDADTGEIYVGTVGVEPDRTFIVQWQDRPHFSGNTVLDGDEATFQIQVFEHATDSNFAQIIFQDTNFLNPEYDAGASATVGYQDSGSQGHMWSQNQPSVPDGTVLTVTALTQPVSVDLNGNGIPDECEIDCRADLDFSDVVDMLDFWTAAQHWTGSHTWSDLDANGIVDLRDILLILNDFGPCD